ncbi:IclR family transcriptional regulator [Murinocardiopsis flavida]|uniref:Glycerol operon regulatory protein n=1 Tax=Murinocardiopsis flavida TaxID=645275 RepID=A0A2P8CXB3_9ACTN|nr:IclR family transcriptional regulator [Murinocardiopsis flavida]PSK89622.1 IclR family transcriptional regulator [Murinocardiopsis flavida]
MGPVHVNGGEHAARAAPGSGRVQSLERAIALLTAVAASSPDGETVADLAAACGLNRATAWRLLATLEQHALVERDPSTNRYSIGFAIAHLAASARMDGLIRRAHGVLERLCATTGETANLAVTQRVGLTYIDEVAPQAVLSARWLGHQASLHATSTGKTLLAWLPESEAETMLAETLSAHTGTTITDPSVLRAELAATRGRGYGVSVGEMESSVFGVSAPVLDSRARPLAVLGIWGPDTRVPESRFPELGELAKEAAEEIARSITP